MILGPHHGIIYRRAELKELINMHSNVGSHGGDLKHDTVTIIGKSSSFLAPIIKLQCIPLSKRFL